MIKKAKQNDAKVLAKLAIKLWKENKVETLEEEFKELLKNDKAICFIKYINDTPIGFIQCELREDYVEGTTSSPVGYIEGIFIEKEYRLKGYAKELVKTCEKWAKEKNCKEFASDCELNNIDSFYFHLAIGFIEANRIICFKKDL